MTFRPVAVLVAVLATGSVACTREEIVSVEPGNAPGETAPTVEALLNTAVIPDWTDTVFSGFSGPSNAGFIAVQESPDLVSHGLFRIGIVRDTVFVADTFSAVIAYDSARIIATVDANRSDFTDADITVQLRTVEQDWHNGTATWQLAVDTVGAQVPWTTPGGSFGSVLDEVVVTAADDSVVFELGAATDSLLSIWADTSQANLGLAFVVADSGLFVTFIPLLVYGTVPELFPDTTVVTASSATERTFVFDPPAPPVPTGVLRLGGVNGFRIYGQLVLGDSILVTGGTGVVAIGGAQINAAQLIIRSLNAPAPPFGAEAPFSSVTFRLAINFDVLGPKTPVAELVEGSDIIIDPDSLVLGSELRIDFTSRLQELADSLDRFGTEIEPQIRFGIRAIPEGSTFGYWEFGSAEGDSALAPILRIILTGATAFGLP